MLKKQSTKHHLLFYSFLVRSASIFSSFSKEICGTLQKNHEILKSKKGFSFPIKNYDKGTRGWDVPALAVFGFTEKER